MSKEEAIQLLKEGAKVTHDYFLDHEYIYLSDGKIHDENGYNIDTEFWKYRHQAYWQIGWKVFE